MLKIVALACLSFGLVFGYRLPARIIGGQDTDTGVHRHQVSLQYLSSSGSFSHVCGASILSSRWILTAAHCVEFANYDVTLFRIATNNGKLDDVNMVSYDIKEIIPHESYNPSGGLFQPAFPNDIALIELTNDIDLFTFQAIPLIESNADLAGETCTISGWGHTVTGTGTKEIPNTLQETTGTILTKAQCESVWNTILNPSYSHSHHVCIDDSTTGSCNGDSGGPMVCDGKLAGVTSWGASGCDTTMPSVYVRVQNYISWINSKMATPTFL